MGLEVECLKCRHWNSESASICKGRFLRGPKKGEVCEFSGLKKAPNKNYRIEYRLNGKEERRIPTAFRRLSSVAAENCNYGVLDGNASK